MVSHFRLQDISQMPADTGRLRVTKWIGTVPAIAVCTKCQREFRGPITMLRRTLDAQSNLKMQFDRPNCETRSEPQTQRMAGPKSVLYGQEQTPASRHENPTTYISLFEHVFGHWNCTHLGIAWATSTSPAHGPTS